MRQGIAHANRQITLSQMKPNLRYDEKLHN